MLDPSFAIKSKSTPDVLMELSIDAFNHFQGNTIHLSGITIEREKICYQNVNYGSNVHKSIPKCCKGNQIWQEINLNRMVNNYVLVTVDKLEVCVIFTNDILIETEIKQKSHHDLVSHMRCYHDDCFEPIIIKIILWVGSCIRTNF